MKITTFLLSAIIFIVTAFFVVSYAAGYKVDLVNRKIKQTAMLDIQTRVKESEILVNGELKGAGSVIVRDLEPGNYEIKVQKPGYHDWIKTVELKSGQAETLNDIALFLLEPKIEEFKGDIKSESISQLAEIEDIRVNSGEVFQNGNLITRLSSDVKGACWYPDRRYVAFTAENKLNIIEIDGTNRIEVLDKKSDSPVVFVNSGVSVIYESEGKIYRATIR